MHIEKLEHTNLNYIRSLEFALQVSRTVGRKRNIGLLGFQPIYGSSYGKLSNNNSSDDYKNSSYRYGQSKKKLSIYVKFKNKNKCTDVFHGSWAKYRRIEKTLKEKYRKNSFLVTFNSWRFKSVYNCTLMHSTKSEESFLK